MRESMLLPRFDLLESFRSMPAGAARPENFRSTAVACLQSANCAVSLCETCGTAGRDLTKQTGIGIMIQSANANAGVAVQCSGFAAERHLPDTI